MIKTQTVHFAGMNEDHIRAIRGKVFVEEQNVPSELDFDDEDPGAFHVLVFSDDIPCGTGRMLDDGHIGRIAVLKEFRGIGLGSIIVEALVNLAIEEQYPRVYLGSQKHAIGFYQKLGFTTYGEEFLDAGIEHISMEKLLK